MFHNFLNSNLKYKPMKWSPEGKTSENWINPCKQRLHSYNIQIKLIQVELVQPLTLKDLINETEL